MKRIDQKQVNQMLMSNGLAPLDDPALVPQIGFLASHVIKSHEQFREFVNRTEPAQRPLMYEALKPYIRFELKPLDVYIAELADLAERKQLPIQNEDGTLSEFKVPEIKSEEQKLAQELCEGAALSHFLELTCASCTYYQRFAGWNKQACIDRARVEGWRAVHSKARNEDAELCPACIERYWPSLKTA